DRVRTRGGMSSMSCVPRCCTPSSHALVLTAQAPPAAPAEATSPRARTPRARRSGPRVRSHAVPRPGTAPRATCSHPLCGGRARLPRKDRLTMASPTLDPTSRTVPALAEQVVLATGGAPGLGRALTNAYLPDEGRAVHT